jgi:putative transposase
MAATATRLPPWGTVAVQFYRWQQGGLWQKIHDAWHAKVRQQADKKPQPSAGILDSQSVQTTEQGGPCGYEAGKNINGRKRQVVVDPLGWLIVVLVPPANVQDDEGAQGVLAKAKKRFPRLQLVWADGGYTGRNLVDRAGLMFTIFWEIVKRPLGAGGCVVLHRRWVVERTFAWLGRYRRLSEGYERSPQGSEDLIYLAMIPRMLCRLRPATRP